MACRPSCAQIYHFDRATIPANKSLHVLYTYYIYSRKDSPEHTDQQAFVKFHSVSSRTMGRLTDRELSDYEGIQLSIMKFDDFWNVIDPKKFCCSWEDVQARKCKKSDQLLVQKPPGATLEDTNVYLHTARFPNSSTFHPRDKRMDVHSTGVYILMFSNCGDYTDATVSGSVLVKNPYGYLPGIDYHKMPFYGWLSLGYTFLAVIWMALSLRWWRELFNIQNCVAVVILFGLMESFLWYIYFNDWNTNGTRGKFLFVLAILSSVVKSVFSYMLVLVASLGWGVTRPFLDKMVVLKIQAVCFLYIVLDVIREVVLSFRHTHSLSLAFVLLCLLPVSLLNGAIFYWVFTALSTLIQTLQERKQTAKLVLFQRLWRILVFSLTVATGSLLYQIFTFSRSISSRWMYQWMFTDGVSHIIFLFVLICMMYLWAPHKYSQRYAYSQLVDYRDADDENDSGKPTSWAEDTGLDDEAADNDDFWNHTRGVNFDADDSGNTGSPSGRVIGNSGGVSVKETNRDLDNFGVGEEPVAEKLE